MAETRNKGSTITTELSSNSEEVTNSPLVNIENCTIQNIQSYQSLYVIVVEKENTKDEIEIMKESNGKNPNISNLSSIVLNFSDIDKENGWQLHYRNNNEEMYYFYEDGIRTRKMEKIDSRWKETDLLKNDGYYMGERFNRYGRDGIFEKYKDGSMIEANVYHNGKQVGYHYVFDNMKMKEYDLNGNLLYDGEYSVNYLKRLFVRNGLGKEYCNTRLIYDGKWKDNLPNGHGTLYLDNGLDCLEGDWVKGYLPYRRECYSYKNKRFESGIAGVRWMWSEVVIALLCFFIGNTLAICLDESMFACVVCYSLGYSVLLFLQQLPYGDCTQCIYTCLFIIAFGIILGCLNKLPGVSLLFYFDIACVVVGIQQTNHPINNNLFRYLCSKPEGFFVFISILSCYVYPFHSIYLTTSRFNDVIKCQFVYDAFTCILCAVLSYLYCCKEIWLEISIWISIIWSVLAIGMSYLFNWIYLCFLVNTLLSICVYNIKKPSKKLLPVSHPISSV